MISKRVSIIAIAMGLLTHAAIWLYPVAPAGLANLAAFFAWCIALLVLFGAVAMIFRPPDPTPWEFPWLLKVLLRASRWGGLAWLIYHGSFALPAVLLLGTGIAWVARQVHEDAPRGEA